ncbi:MAG: nicotinamide riboside transporter PnuC [Steroidobacteraceae bacterium]
MTGAFLAQLLAALRATSPAEGLAVLLALAYLVLAIRESVWCWAAAFVSSLLYVLVLHRAHLYMESLLNAFYALMAVYGWWQWRARRGEGALRVHRWPWRRHAAAAAAVILISLASSRWLAANTAAAWPFADSLVTWSSVFATFLVARKVYENWHWWLAIDSAAAVLYFTRSLYATMLLFLLYLVLIFQGLRQWRVSLDVAAGEPAAHG